MQSTIITLIFNLTNVVLAGVILVISTKLIKNDIRLSTRKRHRDIFGDTETEKVRVHETGLAQFSSIGAFVLPLLVLSIIYLMLLESFYELTLSYIKIRGIATNIAGGIVAIIVFFAGKSFARKFLIRSQQTDDLHDTEDAGVIENRLRKVEICYLSATFFIIVFNYLDFDLKFNLIKAITTSFVAGNMYYVVFRQNTRTPWILKNNALQDDEKKELNNSTKERSSENDYGI